MEKEIEFRRTRRRFSPALFSRCTREHLKTLIARANSHPGAGIHFSLVLGDPQAFSNIFKTRGLFSGVHSYIVAAATRDDPLTQQLIGYYGEMMVLNLARSGICSCWVGKTYNKRRLAVPIWPDEKLFCVIAIGFPTYIPSAVDVAAYFMKRLKKHKAEQIMEYHGEGQPPRWFMKGIEAVLRAPSAHNRLPVHFSLDRNRGCVRAWADPNGGFENIDLGIAKLHFELGANYVFYDLRKRIEPAK